MPKEVARIIRETELALCLGNASHCMDVRAVPFEVKIGYRFHKLYSPEHHNFAHQTMARVDAEAFVSPAKWWGYRE